MVWVNFQYRGVLLIWIIVGQGPTALAVGVGGGCLDIISLVYHFSPLSPSLWETARYRLKYCLKGPLNPKTTNRYQLHCILTCLWRFKYKCNYTEFNAMDGRFFFGIAKHRKLERKRKGDGQRAAFSFSKPEVSWYSICDKPIWARGYKTFFMLNWAWNFKCS